MNNSQVFVPDTSTGLPSDVLLTRADVAARLQITTHSVARYTKSGQLPAIFINRRLIRYKAEDVEKLIRAASHRIGGA